MVFLFFLVFLGLLGASLIFRHLRSPGFSVYRAAAGLFRVATLVLRILVVGISRRFAFQNKILSSTQNLWLQGRRPFKMKFFLRIHALNTSLILVLTSLYKSVGLTARQLAFLAFVVAPVELIYDEVLDVFKMFLQRLVPMNMSFKMTRVIVDDGIGVDFFHLHGCPNYLHLVWQTFVDQMLLCC